ncbi:MAG: TonB-dependent receptor plug domain-containing protein [Alphaproteobacteria bacterium]
MAVADEADSGRRTRRAAGLGLLLLCLGGGMAAAQPTLEELGQMSIEELANLQVTSVSKRAEPVSDAAASIYVITAEDIRRSGATSLPEALRLAPNLQVARQDAQAYAISARGLNSFESSNKLLVMIDGRSVYSPLFSGVFWEQQNVMLEDVERIEVISGPGGTLWGANAVNGVINVITKNAGDTQGQLAGAFAGNVDKGVAARHGGRVDNTAYRVYAMGQDRGYTARSDGSSGENGWANRQGGFRADWAEGRDRATIQGDVYHQPVEGDAENLGGNALARWQRDLDGGQGLEFQAYFDRTGRRAPGITNDVDTVDLSGQHHWSPGARHEVVWGGGYRFIADEFTNTTNAFTLEPQRASLHLLNGFVQDAIDLGGAVTLTLGTKVEYWSLSGLDTMPSAHLAWQPSETATLWGSVARAVRTPSRVDADLEAPGILQDNQFESEELIAYELGYRGRPLPDTSISATVYYHDYDKLRTGERRNGGLPAYIGNGMHGYTYGAEIWGDQAVRRWWRLSAGLNVLRKSFTISPESTDTSSRAAQGNDPAYQASLRSRMDLPHGLEFDVGLRAVDQLPLPSVPGYLEIDARLGWNVTDSLELSVAGANLLDSRHPETGPPATRQEVRRSVHVGARWRF